MVLTELIDVSVDCESYLIYHMREGSSGKVYYSQLLCIGAVGLSCKPV